MNIEGILMDILNTILVAREMKEVEKNEEIENILYRNYFFDNSLLGGPDYFNIIEPRIVNPDLLNVFWDALISALNDCLYLPDRLEASMSLSNIFSRSLIVLLMPFALRSEKTLIVKIGV